MEYLIRFWYIQLISECSLILITLNYFGFSKCHNFILWFIGAINGISFAEFKAFNNVVLCGCSCTPGASIWRNKKSKYFQMNNTLHGLCAGKRIQMIFVRPHSRNIIRQPTNCWHEHSNLVMEWKLPLI